MEHGWKVKEMVHIWHPRYRFCCWFKIKMTKDVETKFRTEEVDKIKKVEEPKHV
jgi:hypothetical protein